jgi:hypothetical protein
MNVVPFTIPHVYAGLAEVRGAISLRRDALVMEYRTVDAVFGALRSRWKQSRLPVQRLVSVRFERDWSQGRLVITARGPGLLASLPGASGSELALLCRGEHQAAGQELASSVRRRLPER